MMTSKPMNALAVAALLLAGSASAQEGGARSVSFLRLGANSEVFDGTTFAYTESLNGVIGGAAQAMADPGYMATADISGFSSAESEYVDTSGVALSLAEIFFEADATANDGVLEANTLVDGFSGAAQFGEGEAEAGVTGEARADANPETFEDPSFETGEGDASAGSAIRKSFRRTLRPSDLPLFAAPSPPSPIPILIRAPISLPFPLRFSSSSSFSHRVLACYPRLLLHELAC